MYEVRDRWPDTGTVATVPVAELSERETYSKEINILDGEGGGLNANYQQYDAGMVLANRLGRTGLAIENDFIFKTVGSELRVEFRTQELYDRAARMVQGLSKVPVKEAA